jgi:hypothetical protein
MGSIFRFLAKLIGWGILIFLIYFILGCMHAAFQGIINMPDEDGGPSIKETWENLFGSSGKSALKLHESFQKQI